MQKRPTTPARNQKRWQAPELTVLPADEAKNAPTAVMGDGPISMGS
jgi:hypothetical protein